MNGVLARNIQFSQLIIDHQRKLRESSESLHAAEDISRKLSMEVVYQSHTSIFLILCALNLIVICIIGFGSKTRKRSVIQC